LDQSPQNLTSDNESLKTENNHTDQNNFLKNVFFLEKFAEKVGAKTFHCFAQEAYDIYMEDTLAVLKNYTISNCWPEWDKHEKRELHNKPSLATDGIHYGKEHHEVFARLFLQRFNTKLR
jgi:hypothetical protein